MDLPTDSALTTPLVGELVSFPLEGTQDRRCGKVSGSVFVGADGRPWVWVFDATTVPAGAYKVPVRELQRGCGPAN
jgi:hypothetical protein